MNQKQEIRKSFGPQPIELQQQQPESIIAIRYGNGGLLQVHFLPEQRHDEHIQMAIQLPGEKLKLYRMTAREAALLVTGLGEAITKVIDSGLKVK